MVLAYENFSLGNNRQEKILELIFFLRNTLLFKLIHLVVDPVVDGVKVVIRVFQNLKPQKLLSFKILMIRSYKRRNLICC